MIRFRGSPKNPMDWPPIRFPLKHRPFPNIFSSGKPPQIVCSHLGRPADEGAGAPVSVHWRPGGISPGRFSLDCPFIRRFQQQDPRRAGTGGIGLRNFPPDGVRWTIGDRHFHHPGGNRPGSAGNPNPGSTCWPVFACSPGRCAQGNSCRVPALATARPSERVWALLLGGPAPPGKKA